MGKLLRREISREYDDRKEIKETQSKWEPATTRMPVPSCTAMLFAPPYH